jgi:2-desacetyl-2-hydroxyethyl bacteriochlorophyllide A dehydrogenase
MRRVVVSRSGIHVESAPIPQARPGEVLVRSVIVGICGSDTHAAQGRHPFIRLPYYPGHEVVGRVAAVGPGVDSVQPGQRVTLEPYLPCWGCKQCRAGRPNLCENLGFFGCGHDQGGLADYFTIDARRLHPVSDRFDDQQAALIEPLATPVHAVRIADGVTDRAVVIMGAGTIGLLLLHVARARRARRVVIADRMAERRRRAVALGADAAVDADAPDVVRLVRDQLEESADVAFDCVTTPATVRDAIAMVGKGGTVVVVGVPAAEVSIPLPIVQDQQIRIQGSATYLPADFADSIDLLERGQVRPQDVVSSVVPLERVAEAFAQAASGRHAKVLVDMGQEA